MQDDAAILDVPVFIIAFDRPDYLGRLCASLKAQRGVHIPDERLHLIQDGAVSPRSGLVYGDAEKIAASVAVFREHFPGGHVHAAEHNLGIAMNIHRAEQLGFVEQKAPLAYFFEDDLELGPFYMAMMEHLRRVLAPYPNVGYFAAYGRHQQPSDPQAPQLVAMGHLWGFALTRRCWQAMQPWLKPFFDIYAKVDYQALPVRSLAELYQDKALSVMNQGQDATRGVACAAAGFARLQTDVCYARYIGEYGKNFRPDSFVRMGFDKMAFVDSLPAQMPVASAAIVDHINQHFHQYYTTHRRTLYDNEMATLRRTYLDPDRITSREEVEWLWRLVMDTEPGEDVISQVAGKRTLRQFRSSLLRQREARARGFYML